MCANHTPGCISTALLRRRRIALRGPTTVRPGLLSPFSIQYILSLFNSAAPRVAANHPPGCISTALLVRPTQVHLQNFNRGPRFPLKLATAPPQLASPGNPGLVQGCTDTAELPITALTLTHQTGFPAQGHFLPPHCSPPGHHPPDGSSAALTRTAVLLHPRCKNTGRSTKKHRGTRAHVRPVDRHNNKPVPSLLPARPRHTRPRRRQSRYHPRPRTWPGACGQRPPTEG